MGCASRQPGLAEAAAAGRESSPAERGRVLAEGLVGLGRERCYFSFFFPELLPSAPGRRTGLELEPLAR